MNHDMPNARFIVIAALIVLATAWVLISYARAIHCSWCRHPYAIWLRECGELCRSCATIYDLHVISVGRRRSLLQRIRRHWKRITEPPGEWHFGIWKTGRSFSVRLFKVAFVYSG